MNNKYETASVKKSAKLEEHHVSISMCDGTDESAAHWAQLAGAGLAFIGPASLARDWARQNQKALEHCLECLKRNLESLKDQEVALTRVRPITAVFYDDV